MKNLSRLIFAMIIILVLFRISFAATLFGIILDENGKPYSKRNIEINGLGVKTNAFGGYRVEVQEGVTEIEMKINNSKYKSDSVKVYFPETKINWRMDRRSKKLVRIR